MSTIPVLEREGITGMQRLLAAAAVVAAAVAIWVFAVAGPVAGMGAAFVSVLFLWALLDFEHALIGLLVISILIPNGVSVSLGPRLPLVTFQRVMLVLLTAAALVHGPARALAALWQAPGIKLLWAMIAVMGVSTLLSVDPSTSRQEFLSERAIGLPLYFALVWLGLPDHAAVRRLPKGVAIGSVVVLALAVIEAVTGHGAVATLGILPSEKLRALGYWVDLERRAGLPRVQSVFQHPLQFGAYLVALVPLLVALRQGARSRGAWTLVLVLGLFALLYTWSRGAWLMLFASLLFLRGGGWKRWVVIGAGALGLFLLAAQLGLLDPGTGLYRWYLLRTVVSSMWQRNGIGLGLGTFFQHVTVRVGDTPMVLGTDPMAYSLTMAIEAGPVFTALFWWLVVGVIRQGWRARREALAAGERERALLLDALAAGLLANLLLSVYSYSLFGNTVGLFVAYMLLAATQRLARPDHPTEPQPGAA